MKLKYFIFAFTAMLSCFAVSVNAQNVAKVGDTEYATIKDAIANCTNGTTLTLLADLNMSEILTINKAITFNGNGKTLTSSAGRAINVSGAEANGVKIQNLTINASGERAINVINGATNVIVENVTATAANYTVNLAGSATNAVVAIKNSTLNGLCTVNVAAAGAQVTVDNSTVNCNDNNTTVGESYAALCLNKDAVGGSIVATNTTVNVAEGSDSEKGRNGAENGTVTINGSTEGVTVMVAVITYSGSNYYHAFATIEDAVKFAKEGDTITLIRDVTVAEKITIAKSISLDGNGKTLTYTGTDRAIDVPANADAKVNVTIENLTVDCTASYCQRGINYNEDGKLKLNNVTVKGTNVTYALNLPGSSDKCEVAINNSSLTGNIALNVWGENSTINADNTTFTAVDNSTEEGYAAVMLNNDGTTSAEGSVITIIGGKIDVTGSACTDTEATSNATSTGKINISDSTVVNGKNAEMVAVIRYADGNSYSFMTIEDAIEFAKTGETVTLLRDITASNIITINKAITLDGNGKTITYTGSDRAIDVPANADAKVNVTIEKLTVDCTASYCQRGINYNDDGALKLNNVTVKGTNVTYALNLPGSSDKCEVAINNSSLTGNIALNVWGENSTINADNTTFTAVDNSTEEGYAAVMLNNDGTTSAEGSVITIIGGKIDVTGSACTDTEATSNATSTGKINISDSTVVNGKNAEMVAVIRYADGNSYSFMTIEDAIAKAQAGETVTLLRDVKINELVKIEKAITLDLNGKKVTSTAQKAFEVHADATIKNGAIEAVQRCVDTRKAVKLTLTGVELVAKSTTYGNPQPLTIGGSDNGTEVTMENVEINAGTAGYGIITFVETKLTAKESAISGYSVLYVKPGSDNSVFNFVDSDLSGSTVGNDVEGNSFSVIAVRANNVTVNVDAASTVTAAGNYSYAISFKSKSDIDTPATGSSVTVAGTITGNILADLNGNTVKVKAEYADELAAAGYATIEAENGLVAAIKAVAKIGETYYATLAEAFDAAQDGKTITVLQDIEVSETIVNTKKVTLNLNGKTVTMVYTQKATKNHTMISNSGNLTIESSVEGGKLSYTYAGENIGTTYSVNTVTSNPGSVLTVKSGTIENLTYDNSVIAYAIDGLTNGGAGDVTVNIEGGVITSKRQAVRIFANSTTNTGALNISGGDITGRVIVQNASAKANKAALNITGGTFNANDYKTDVLYVGGSNSATIDINASVSGGTFKGEITDTNVKGFITGGTFYNLIDETFLAMGYQLTGDAAPYTVADTGEVTKLVLVDGDVTEFVNEKEITVGTLTYKRSNIKNTWTPFYVPFAVPVSALADKFDVAYINDVRRTDSDDDGELDKFSMEIIYIHGGNANGSAKTLKANYPYFIRSKSGQTETMEITLTNAKVYAKENVFDCTTMTEKFEIKGNYHQIPSDELTENDYVVGGGEWHPLADGYSLNPFRFYMTKSSRFEDEPAAPMQSMRIIVCGEEDENGATIIYDVVEDSLNNNGNDFIYDLQGRRVSEPKKGGIYIKNGKKILY